MACPAKLGNHRAVPAAVPAGLKRKTWDLYELGSLQFTRTYELWMAYYVCNPTCDKIADKMEPEIRCGPSDWP